MRPSDSRTLILTCRSRADADFVCRCVEKRNIPGIYPANGVRWRPCNALSVASGHREVHDRRQADQCIRNSFSSTAAAVVVAGRHIIQKRRKPLAGGAGAPCPSVELACGLIAPVLSE